jgi:hypothetical protein
MQIARLLQLDVVVLGVHVLPQHWIVCSAYRAIIVRWIACSTL